MQVSTLTAQLGCGLALVDWFKDATSVRHDHLLTNSLPRTDNRIRNFINSGSIPSNLSIQERSKLLDFLDDESNNLATV